MLDLFWLNSPNLSNLLNIIQNRKTRLLELLRNIAQIFFPGHTCNSLKSVNLFRFMKDTTEHLLHKYGCAKTQMKFYNGVEGLHFIQLYLNYIGIWLCWKMLTKRHILLANWKGKSRAENKDLRPVIKLDNLTKFSLAQIIFLLAQIN